MSERRWRWVWQPDQGEGAEEFHFRATDRGLEARGDVTATLEGKPLKASYLVETDAAWRTRHVRVAVEGGGTLEILSDGAGHWQRADGAQLPQDGDQVCCFAHAPSPNRTNRHGREIIPPLHCCHHRRRVPC